MRNIPNKADDVSTLPAIDFNSLKNELINLINIYLVIGGDDLQIARTISNYLANGDFYIDAGVADAYVVTRVATTGTGDPISVSEILNGMRIRFFANVTNSGDPSGATITVGGFSATPIKKFNNDPLSAGEIVSGEMTELVFVSGIGPSGAFVVASSSNTRMITKDTVIGVSAGGPFTTLHDAYESIRDKYILDNVVVTIEIGGTVVETEPTVIAHSEGNNIRIVGEPSQTVDITAVNSVGGGAGAFIVEYEISASLDVAIVGDYVIIHDAVSSGPDVLKEYGRKHEGIWIITAVTATDVTVLNKFGFAMADALKTNDLSSAKLTLINARLDYAATDCLTIKNTSLNLFSDISIVNTAGSGGSTLSLENASIDLGGNFLGVVSETQKAVNVFQSKIINGSLVPISDTDNSIDAFSSSLFLDSFIVNASGSSFRALTLTSTNLRAIEFICCGNPNVISTTFDTLNSDLDIVTLSIIANAASGMRLLNTRAFITNINLADNLIGGEIWGASSLSSLVGSGKVHILDNNRGGVGSKVGLRILNCSTVVMGVYEISSNFAIDTIQITGHTDEDVEVAVGSSAAFIGVGANSSIPKATALQVSNIVHNAIIGSATQNPATFSIISSV